MPNGTKESGVKAAGAEYHQYGGKMPYQVYINWGGSYDGNIIYNDKKFVRLLYEAHEDYFGDVSKVTDAGFQTKNDIYNFLEDSEKVQVVVDCENAEPYKLYAVLNNLNQQSLLNKIDKIVLYDDVHTTSAWDILETRYADSYRTAETISITVSFGQSVLFVQIGRTSSCALSFKNTK